MKLIFEVNRSTERAGSRVADDISHFRRQTVRMKAVSTVRCKEIRDWKVLFGFKVIKWKVKKSPTNANVLLKGIPEKGVQTFEAMTSCGFKSCDLRARGEGVEEHSASATGNHAGHMRGNNLDVSQGHCRTSGIKRRF